MQRGSVWVEAKSTQILEATQVKEAIQQCRNTLLQVKAQKYQHQNTLNVSKAKSLMMHNGTFQNIILLDYNY